MPNSSSPTGPIPIRDFLEQSGLDDDLYDKLIAANLLRRPRLGPDDTPAHDRRDLTAARAFARLKAAGINYQLLERHSEYSPLSRAEALFLAEHLNFSNYSIHIYPANKSGGSLRYGSTIPTQP
ncbi:MAG: hypothetical protein Ct9H300mP19_12340 [Dehalococcoidia bacterium]|nr:MAG: hypothetical protein Ct9H300mP19_12340 [Dehalococcoidia bacterium]